MVKKNNVKKMIWDITNVKSVEDVKPSLTEAKILNSGINISELEGLVKHAINTVYTDIKKTNKVCIDVREQIGEMIYEVGSGIKDHALAFKIYNSDNEVELTSEEVEVLNKYVSQYCKPAFIQAFLEATKEVEELKDDESK